jgi:sugar phosphate isomerase/epimerase
MTLNRRNFIQQSSLASLAIYLNPTMSFEDFAGAEGKFGIQLWSVKEDMAKDAKATLTKLAAYGYKQIESFAGEKGMFWGMKPKEFQVFTKGLGLDVYGSHCDPNFAIDATKMDEFRKLADDAAAAGLRYLINPFVGMLKTKDEYYKVSESFNKLGEYSKSVDLKYAYHNHHYSFKYHDGELPQDIMMKNTDPALVDFQLDIYWVAAAGHDNIQWIKKYPNRFTLYHIKDMHKQAIKDEIAKTHTPDPFWGLDSSCVLGQGILDIPAIISVAKQNGAKYFSVEQEFFHNSTPMIDAKKDAAYLKKVL